MYRSMLSLLLPAPGVAHVRLRTVLRGAWGGSAGRPPWRASDEHQGSTAVFTVTRGAGQAGLSSRGPTRHTGNSRKPTGSLWARPADAHTRARKTPGEDALRQHAVGYAVRHMLRCDGVSNKMTCDSSIRHLTSKDLRQQESGEQLPMQGRVSS